MKKLFLIALLPLLGAASCEQKPDGDSKVPESLKVACPDLPLLKAGDGAAITRWGVATRSLYESCKLRHEKLVEAVKKLEE